MKYILLVFGLIISFFHVFSQNIQIMQGSAGYATPAEPLEEEAGMFNHANGTLEWKDRNQTIEYFFYCTKTGNLNISMDLFSGSSSKIAVKVGPDSFAVSVPGENELSKVKVGSVKIVKPGFYSIKLSCLSTVQRVATIKSLELTGDAGEGIKFNTKSRRNAASVHLRYPTADTNKVVSFYNELTVPKTFDIVHSYYMACGFSRGYFGMQVNSAHERRIIFSIWDAGNEAIDRNKVDKQNRVQLLAKGIDVVAEDFGNEGTGGHSHWIYNWKTDETYKFMVTALPDTATNTTIYTGYFFIPEFQKWKLIASFSAPKDGNYLNRLYSFNEDFEGANGQRKRKAYFGIQWIRKESGDWMELTEAIFTADATGTMGDRIDYGGGTEGNKFYLWNGGFEPANAKIADSFHRAATNNKPLVDLYKNVDSAAQTKLEIQLINKEIAAGKIDTTGTINGVFYKILKEGTGRNVLLTDTVIASYKGYLLNGEVFDQTKGKPATFPLTRLIKAWQYALPKCRVGGIIKLVIPSALAYSIRSRSAKIPPNSILVFEIEVKEVK